MMGIAWKNGLKHPLLHTSLVMSLLVGLGCSAPTWAQHLVRYHWPEYQQTGEAALKAKHYQKAETMFFKARQELTSHAQENAELAQTYHSLGQLYEETGQFKLAEKYYLQALDIRQRHLGTGSKDTAQSLFRLSEVYKIRGHHDASTNYREQALLIDPYIGGGSETAVSLSGEAPSGEVPLTGTVQSTGQGNRPVQPTLFGFDSSNLQHPDWSAFVNEQGLSKLRVQKFDDAEYLFKAAIYDWSVHSGPRSTRIAEILNNLAAVYDLQGRYGESEPFYQEALKIAKLMNGVQSPEFVKIYGNLKQVLWVQNKTHAMQQLEDQYYPQPAVALEDIPVNMPPTLAPAPKPAKPGHKSRYKKARYKKKAPHPTPAGS